MLGKKTPAVVVCVALVVGLIACTVPTTPAPTAVPQVQTVVVTQMVTPTVEPTPVVVTATVEPTPVVVTVVVTGTPVPLTETPQPPTETPTPAGETPSPPPRPSATPTSSGVLSFPEPGQLDHWEKVTDDDYQCTIVVRIAGGSPPYTVYHDIESFTTSETNPAIVFLARGCSAIVHTITVESADGQTVAHDYAIPPPWCD
jgi:hypothetical protein